MINYVRCYRCDLTLLAVVVSELLSVTMTAAVQLSQDMDHCCSSKIVVKEFLSVPLVDIACQ